MEKKTKNLLLLGISAVFLIGIVAIFVVSNEDKQLKSAAYSASVLAAVTDSVFDFGTISMKNGTVSHKFEVVNNGNEPIIIEKVYTSCMCTTASIINASQKKLGVFGMPGHSSSNANIKIEAGESVTVEAVFDPAAHGPSGVGLAERNVYIETNSSKSPKLELSFRAMVTR